MKISPTELTVPQAGIASNTNAVGGTEVSGTATPGRALISGASGATWQENVQRITADNAPVMGPFVNLASGSNVSLSVSSNSVLIHSTGGGIGTSFPGSPATNDFYYRTDRHIDYYYDGTRWLSKTLYVQPLAVGDAVQPAATNQVVLRGVAALTPTYDAYILSLYLASKVITTNDGSNFWAIALSKHPATTALTYQQTDADTVNVWTSHINAVNALVATTEFELEVSAIKGGAPGNLYLVASVTYRLVG